MVQRGQELRFALEPREVFGITRNRVRKHLDGDVAIERGIVRPVDLAHTACAKQGGDFIRAEAGTEGERHGKWLEL